VISGQLQAGRSPRGHRCDGPRRRG
jgi:hypothetical protein